MGAAFGAGLAAACVLVQPAKEAKAFCLDEAGSTCHVGIVRDALGFLRPAVLRAVADNIDDPDRIPDIFYKSDDHFDSCNFDGGTAEINRHYLSRAADPLGMPHGVVARLSPFRQTTFLPQPPPPTVVIKDRPAVFRAAARWAWPLHAAQDLYSHSNWVEMGFRIVPLHLFDTGLGPWTVAPSDWGSRIRGDVVHAQSGPPPGWSIRFPDGLHGRRLPEAITPNGERLRVLHSADPDRIAPPTQGCPSGVGMDHASLHKDDRSRPFYEEALAMAVGQTRHEWCRLLHTTFAENGAAGAAVPMALMVAPGRNPHPGTTPCRPAPPGSHAVTVKVTRIKVLNDLEDGGPGRLNFVLALFTEDFRRSARTQTPKPIRAGAGLAIHATSLLPQPIRMCVSSEDRLVATVQGWEDDGSEAGGDRAGELTPSDDVLAGATRVLGQSLNFANQLASARFTLRSDNTHREDIEVTFEVTAAPDVPCEPQVVQ